MRRGPGALALAASVALGCRFAETNAAVALDDVAFSTYLGASAEDTIRDVAVDAAGNVFAVGGTASPDFPVTPGAAQTAFGGEHDAWIAKLSPEGKLLWASFLGGPSYDRAYAVDVDAEGNPVVAGRAGVRYPTTSGVVQPFFAGDETPNPMYGPQDGFVTKLSADGARVLWSTLLGTNDDGFVRDVALDGEGRPVVAMAHQRATPWVTPGAYQTTIRGEYDGFAARLAADATRVEWGTYFGGTGKESGQPSVRIAQDGIVVVTTTWSTDAPVTPDAIQKGSAGKADVLLVKLSLDGARLLYATYLGGSGNDGFETHNLGLAPDGAMLVAGGTTSPDLRVSEGAFQPRYGGGDGEWSGDAFVARIAADGSALLGLTYLGGPKGDALEGVWATPDGDVVVSGVGAEGFPTTAGPAQRKLRGAFDAFVTRLSPDLRTLRRSALIGGSGADMGRASALHPSGDVVLGAVTLSPDFPLRAAFQERHASLGKPEPEGRDGAVVRLRLPPAGAAPAR
jgi:hypothetical protein